MHATRSAELVSGPSAQGSDEFLEGLDLGDFGPALAFAIEQQVADLVKGQSQKLVRGDKLSLRTSV